MTKSVATDGEISQKPVQIPTAQPLKLPLMKQQSPAQQLKHNSQTSKKQSSKNQSAQLILSNQIIPQISKINLIQVPSEQSQQYPESDQNPSIIGLPSTSGSQQFADQIPNQQNSSTPQSHSSKIQSPNTSNQVQVVSSQVPKVQATISPKTQPNIQTLKTSPISLTPKIQLTVKSNKKMNSPPSNKHQMKLQHSKAQGTQTPVKQLSADTSLPITVPLFISKDDTLIPKLPSEPVQVKIEPSLLEPVIDIVEEENILSQDGTFLFKIDSYCIVDLPNEQKIYSCDICFRVYTHSNMLRKHYLRLHISRKYISEKDMETFNIDREPLNEKEEEKLIFRCHTCRECFPTKSDLRSHLTDHPPNQSGQLKKKKKEDLPNEQKVYTCDICFRVYTHSNMLRKHYLRLHISRKYISEKDMETFNIDHEPVNEKEEQKLIFRCHMCRECFSTKSDLRSHLTDHPPVVELVKQNNKSHPSYKCENCLSFFKWRKQFEKHKKACKPSPPPPSEKPDLFHCLYCNETFLNGNTKRNHILSNHPCVRRKRCCVFCKRDGFPTNVSLFLHLLNDHPTVYFACQVCKERFSNLEELKAHADKRHDQDDKLKSSLSERVSTLKQEKDYYSCDNCQRKFLVESSFKEHICFPEKLEKPKPKRQKIKKKVYPLSERLEKSSNRNVDLETLFYSRVAGNVRDNLLHHLDGKIYQDEPSEEDQNYGAPSPNVSTRTFLNFSAGFPSSSEIQMDDSGAETPSRVKAPWEPTFPKNYDGRCGLTSYIKDTSYFDISTQLIMRRNLQRLNMLPMKESPSDDVPSVLGLKRLSTECAESFGQLKKKKKEDDGDETQELGSLSGEWVRERMYVCSACRWESPCFWTMEDHKYIAHPRVHCPQHELIGDQTSLSKTIYKRLVTEVPNPYKGPSLPTPPSPSSISCTKCSKTGFSNQTELHVHIIECAGVVVEAIGPISSSRRRRRRTRRRPRQGLLRKQNIPSTAQRNIPSTAKRNIPSTAQKPQPKQRTKPGDTDTIQRMIANLPAKRVSRKVFSGYEDNKAKLNEFTLLSMSSSEMQPPCPKLVEEGEKVEVIFQVLVETSGVVVVVVIKVASKADNSGLQVVADGQVCGKANSKTTSGVQEEATNNHSSSSNSSGKTDEILSMDSELAAEVALDLKRANYGEEDLSESEEYVNCKVDLKEIESQVRLMSEVVLDQRVRLSSMHSNLFQGQNDPEPSVPSTSSSAASCLIDLSTSLLRNNENSQTLPFSELNKSLASSINESVCPEKESKDALSSSQKSEIKKRPQSKKKTTKSSSKSKSKKR